MERLQLLEFWGVLYPFSNSSGGVWKDNEYNYRGPFRPYVKQLTSSFRPFGPYVNQDYCGVVISSPVTIIGGVG